MQNALKFLIIGVSAISPVIAVAEKPEEQELICPAVYPCLEDGSVGAPFDQGACGEYFKKMCANDRVNEVIGECAEESEVLRQRVAKLSAQVRKLNKARRSRSSR